MRCSSSPNHFRPMKMKSVKRREFRIMDNIIAGIQGRQREYLKGLQLPRNLWPEKKYLALEKLFVEPTMNKKDSEGKEMIETVALEDMFQMEEEKIVHPLRILIEGHPGFGKTTLLLKIFSDWSKGEHYVRSRYSLAFLILLKSFKGRLETHFHQQCHSVISTEEETAQLIHSVEGKVLLLLDGWDEATEETKTILVPLLKRKIYPNVTIVLTTRTGFYHWPEQNDDFLNELGDAGYEVLTVWEKRIQMKGISREKTKEFLKKYLQLDRKELCNTLDKLPVCLTEFCRCPMFPLFLALLIEGKKIKNIRTKTQLYKSIFNFVVNRSLIKKKKLEKHEQIDIFDLKNSESSVYREATIGFGRQCLQKLKVQSHPFTEIKIFVEGVNIYDLGFLTKTVLFFEHQEMAEYEPIIKSFLEFLAALYLSTIDETALKMEVKELFQMGITPTKRQLVYHFLSGLLDSDAKKLFDSLLPFNDFIPLLDVKHNFRCTLRPMLDEILNPNEEILKSLIPFVPKYLIDDDDDVEDLVSLIEFLQSWVAPVVNLSSEIQVMKEFRMNKKCLDMAELLNTCFKPFRVNKMIMSTKDIASLTSIDGEFKCRKLFIECSCENLSESFANKLKKLTKFCCSDTLSLEICYPQEEEMVQPWIQAFNLFCKDLTNGELKNVNIHHLSFLRMHLNHFPSFSSSIVDLIETKTVTSGIEFSFESQTNKDQIYDFLCSDTVTAIVNSHIESLVFQVVDPIIFPLAILERQQPWKYLDIKGQFLAPLFKYKINSISLNHFNCIDVETPDKNLLPLLLQTYNNIKKLNCQNIESIQLEEITDWKEIVTIETLKLNMQTINDAFLSLVSRFKNLRKLKINNLCLTSEEDSKLANHSAVEVLLKIVSSLPHLISFSLQCDDGHVLYEFLERLSRLTEEEKSKLRLEKLVLNSVRVNPFPMKENIEEYKWFTRNEGILEKFKIRQQEKYKQEWRVSRLTWLEEDALLDQIMIVETENAVTEGEEDHSRALRMDQLFEAEVRNILIEGSTKSVNHFFCCKLLSDWATGKEYVGRKYSLVFHCDVKDFLEDDFIEQLLIEKFPKEETTSDEDIIAYVYKYQHRILLILEGYDEMSEETKRQVEPLLHLRQLPKLHIMVTCSEINSISSKHYLTLTSKQAREEDERINKCFHRRLIIKLVDGPLIKDWLGIGTRLMDTIASIRRPIFLVSLHIMIQSVKEGKLKRKTNMYINYFNYICKTLSNTEREVNILTFLNCNSSLSPEHEYVQTLDRYGKYALEKMLRKESLFISEDELKLNCGDKSILQFGFLAKTGDIYKPIDDSFVEFTAALSTFNVLRKSGEDIFKREIQKTVLREGLRPKTDDSLFFPFLAGLLNDRAGLMFEALFHLFDWFDLANVTYTNMLMEIIDIRPFVDSIRSLLPSIFPPCYRTSVDFAPVDKDFRSSPIYSLLFNSALESNAIQTLQWTPIHLIPLKENVKINHLLLLLDADFLYTDNQIDKANSLNSQTLSVFLGGSFNVERWSYVVRLLEWIKRNKICFCFLHGDKEITSSLLICLHNELTEGRWREETIDRVKINIGQEDDPKSLRHLVDLITGKKIKEAVYLQIVKAGRNKELKVDMKLDLEVLFDSIFQSKTISEICISNKDSSISPVFDFSRSHGEENVTFKSVYLHGSLTVLNGNERATLSIEETTALCWDDEKNYQFIRDIQGIKWLQCFTGCFDCLVEEKWSNLHELEELTLVLTEPLRLNPSISNLNQLRVLNFIFCNIKQIPCGSDLYTFGWLSSLSLRIIELIYIPRDISFFDWVVDCVVKGLDGKKENSKSNTTLPLEELLVSFNSKESSGSPFDWNDLKESKGIKAIQRMLQIHLLRQFSLVDKYWDFPRDLPRSLFSLEDEFNIKLKVDGSDPSHSRLSQWKYRTMNTPLKYCITSKTE